MATKRILKELKYIKDDPLTFRSAGVGAIGVMAFGFLLRACFCSRPKKEPSSSQGTQDELVFFEGCNYTFDLNDLLTANAELLGRGTFGVSFKTTFDDTNVVVVKRLKDVRIGTLEFVQHMNLIGSIKHENVVPLRAYYCDENEKLMVSEHCNLGSVSKLLHGPRGDRSPLDWGMRLRIVIGAARGISHIHSKNAGKFVHGNIKSSNIFLNSHQYGSVSDLGIATIAGPLAPSVSHAAGYRAPEISDTRKATQASDVYSFGVVLLELLTGKSPVHATGGDELVHLVNWVSSVVREEWTSEVFDLDLLRYPRVEDEMVEMLQIALMCVAKDNDQRPKMMYLLKMIEDVPQSGT